MLRSISRSISALNDRVGRAVSWLTAVLVLFVFFDVIAQKVFDFSTPWIMEVEWHLYALIFLLGSGYALRHGKHVRVDLFYEKFSDREKALTDFWGTLLFLIPWCVAVIWYAFGYALDSFRINESSSQPNGLPAVYIIKFSIVIGIFLVLLQGVAMLIDAALVLWGKDQDASNDHFTTE